MSGYYKPTILIPYRDGDTLKILRMDITEDRTFSRAWVFKAIKKFILVNFGKRVDRAWIESNCRVLGNVDELMRKMTQAEHEQLDMFAALATKEALENMDNEVEDEGPAELPQTPAGSAG